MAQRPNIILITTDQQRYDTLGVTGNLRVKTPHLDALANRGVLFESAYIQNTVCVPSRACIQTGRYTHQHGCHYMETVIDTTPGLPPWEKTFMEHLQDAGYRTGAVGKIHMYPEKGFHEMALTGGKGARWTQSEGLPIGPGPLGPNYRRWLEARHPGGYELIYEQRRRPEYKEHMTAIVNVLPTEEYVDFWIADEAIHFLQREDRRPFFLWVGFCGPHPPFDPPAEYARRFRLEDIPLPRKLKADSGGKPPFLRGSPRFLSPDADTTVIRRIIAYYWAMMELIDDMIGRILEALCDTGQADKTAILFTTDHGEMLGDFARLGKGVFYEEVIHVPLIVALPGTSASPHRFDKLVELIDIAPTVLDWAGVPIPPPMFAARSLLPILRGQPGGRDSILCEYTTNDKKRKGKCLRTERFKYVTWGCEHMGEFYDLHQDPGELTNLWGEPSHRPAMEEMKDLLLDRLMKTEVV